MSNVYIGQIIHGGWNFAPRGFMLCAGQQIAIQQNSALFSLLGTTYGGNGTTTFGLPDLRGRAMIGSGQGPGLSNYALGQNGGTESTTLSQSNLPPHTHPATFTSTSTFNVAQVVSTHQQGQAAPGSMLGRSVDSSPANAIPRIYAPAGSTPTVPISGLNVAGTVTVGSTGTGIAVGILSPYLTVTIVIATEGIFPSRN